ncbi:MAG: hypothetical protein LC620_00320, partial [Halobacteriales archaeon]|nr:hypothetical protein [Halobacteriales archaeon]
MARAAPAKGRLEGDTVLVLDPAQASRLHGKGSVGEMAGPQLRLRLVEAAWLASDGRLEVESRGRPATPADLLALEAGGGRSEVEFLAYADLRSRGLLVRPWQAGWAVWARGAAADQPPDYALEIQAERDAVGAGSAVAWADRHAVLAVVDEDGSVTYYRAAPDAPKGGCPMGELPRVAGTVLADRVLATDAAASKYQEREYIGVPSGAGLVLSFTEAEALRRRGVLDVPASLATRAAAVQPHFRRTLPVYEALRQAGVVAKSGFKFGTHLRGYKGDPDAGHAEWLVQCALPEETLHWADLSRAIRVAHGVRKHLL